MKRSSRAQRSGPQAVEVDPFAQIKAMPPPSVELHIIEPNGIDPLVHFMSRAVWNIGVARRKRLEARHKTVKVGAVIAGSLPDGSYIEAISANENLGEGSGPLKKCAERTALERLAKLGVTVVHGIVLVGDHQPDAQSGIEGLTLQPCGECRDHASENELVADGIPILSSSPKHDIREVHGLGELREVHAGQLPATDPERYAVDPRFAATRRNIRHNNPYASGVVDLSQFETAAAMVRQTFDGQLAHLSLVA